MTKRATEIRKGNVVILDGELWQVIDQNHHTPGNLRAIINIKFKNLATGQTRQDRYSSSDSFEVAFLEERKCQYLYKDLVTKVYHFMDLENFDQIEVPEDLISESMAYVIEQQELPLTFHNGTPISVELPPSVNLRITESEPATKGNTVSNLFKRAVLETGLEIKVPLHIGEGELVKVSTATGEFMGRAKED
ncbi:MAG TPA: elongation factor P [Planctomycetota bacterium]|jgi:elongation factor P|nr:elongation factor P [Planctomycetota bacterium]